jgi:GT2 family glycosyltransferase
MQLMQIMKNNPLVTLLVLNWNGKKYLKNCIDSLLRTTYRPLEILVVDNNSTDGSLSLIEGMVGVTIHRLQQNLGYAAGNNIGFERAQGKYIAALNNDLTVEPDWLDAAVATLERYDRVGIIACRQMSAAHNDTIDACYLYITRALIAGSYGYQQQFDISDPMLARSGVVVGAAGAAAVYRKEMLQQLGGFDTRFWAYMEESDLSWRAFYHGWSAVYCSQSVVYHHGSASFQTRHKFFLCERNRIFFLVKNYPFRMLFGSLPILLLAELRTIAALIIKRGLLWVYTPARIAALLHFRDFLADHKVNVALFYQRQKLFNRLKREIKLPLAILDSQD